MVQPYAVDMKVCANVYVSIHPRQKHRYVVAKVTKAPSPNLTRHSNNAANRFCTLSTSRLLYFVAAADDISLAPDLLERLTLGHGSRVPASKLAIRRHNHLLHLTMQPLTHLFFTRIQSS